VVLNGPDAISSVVLADQSVSGFTFAGVANRIDQRTDSAGMGSFMSSMLRSTPVIPGLEVAGDVQWLEPKMYCEVEYTQIDQQGVLIDPIITGWSSRGLR
jgi:hypothetical protein